MRRSILLVLPIILASCRPVNRAYNYGARIGIAVKLGDRVCMAIHNAKLLTSASITLLAPASVAQERSSSARALVLTRDAAACPGTKGDGEVSSYNLSITSGSVDYDLPVIALDARVPSVYAAHSFHSCASADGIHLTAWDGAKPLEGQRLWKQYYYSGETYLRKDQAMQCTARETEP